MLVVSIRWNEGVKFSADILGHIRLVISKIERLTKHGMKRMEGPGKRRKKLIAAGDWCLLLLHIDVGLLSRVLMLDLNVSLRLCMSPSRQ